MYLLTIITQIVFISRVCWTKVKIWIKSYHIFTNYNFSICIVTVCVFVHHLFSFYPFYYTPAPRRGRVVYCFTSVLPSVQDIFSRIFLSNYWWQKSDIWSQASYRYPILWEVFLDPSDSYFLFADFVDFYTHWTYMHIFRHIFLSNYWWQRSDIWSQASYRYPILWEAFLDPSDSYFLFADFVDFYTHWTYMHIFLSNYWWQESDIWSQDSYFLFAEERGYHKWALAHSSSCFDFHSARIIFDVSSGFYLWNINKTTAWHL
jgi:hypothetical protein